MGNAWKANKFHADFVGENLISESGTYLPDFMGGGMYIDSTFGAAERFVSTPDVDFKQGDFFWLLLNMKRKQMDRIIVHHRILLVIGS